MRKIISKGGGGKKSRLDLLRFEFNLNRLCLDLNRFKLDWGKLGEIKQVLD